MAAAMILEVVPVGPLATNAYIVGCSATREAAIIDPGDEGRRLVLLAQANELRVRSILLTHGHVDHVGAVGAVKKLTGATVHINEADRFLYDKSPIQARMFGIDCSEPPEPDGSLTDGQLLEIGELEAEVVATPGHTLGGVSIHFASEAVVFSGDTLFRGGIGRTDLPGGSFEQLMSSIRDRLLRLPESTRVYSGHGPATTVGEEKRGNPFVLEMFDGLGGA